MRRSMFKAALPLLLITVLLAPQSCIFDPKEGPDDRPDNPIVWPDMTERDDVIKMVILLKYGSRQHTIGLHLKLFAIQVGG